MKVGLHQPAMNRAALEVADLFRHHGGDFLVDTAAHSFTSSDEPFRTSATAGPTNSAGTISSTSGAKTE
jgi:hypothetical protein